VVAKRGAQERWNSRIAGMTEPSTVHRRPTVVALTAGE
jgi:hypothetical protein